MNKVRSNGFTDYGFGHVGGIADFWADEANTKRSGAQRRMRQPRMWRRIRPRTVVVRPIFSMGPAHVACTFITITEVGTNKPVDVYMFRD